MKKGLLVAMVAAVGIAAIAGCAALSAQPALAATEAPGKEAVMDTVTVTANSSVFEAPDMAQISFGVTSQGKTAEEAQKKNTEQVNKVLAQLEKSGIDKKSIQTTYYNMYANYDYEHDNAITGYNVETTLQVSDQKIEDAGKIITECVDAGVNNINNIEYTCSKYDEKYQEALKNTIAEAKKKAEVLAEASGRELAEVNAIVEGYQDTSAQYRGNGAALESAKMADSAALEPGQMEIKAQATVTYRLK